MSIPDFLCHYYEAARGPLKNLSDCSPEEAEQVMERIRRDGIIFASKRPADYLLIRRDLEQKIRNLFVAKDGQPKRAAPHYFIVGSSPWLAGWYQDGRELRVPITAFDPLTVSLTYGDSFPAMRFQDGKPYRGQVYRLDELPDLVQQYGLPQLWNAEGQFGPERYIEAQVWDDAPLRSLGLLE